MAFGRHCTRRRGSGRRPRANSRARHLHRGGREVRARVSRGVQASPATSQPHASRAERAHAGRRDPGASRCHRHRDRSGPPVGGGAACHRGPGRSPRCRRPRARHRRGAARGPLLDPARADGERIGGPALPLPRLPSRGGCRAPRAWPRSSAIRSTAGKRRSSSRRPTATTRSSPTCCTPAARRRALPWRPSSPRRKSGFAAIPSRRGGANRPRSGNGPRSSCCWAEPR